MSTFIAKKDLTEDNIKAVLEDIPRQPLTGMGRPPTEVPIARKRAQEAYQAYVRMTNMATDKATRQSQPRLVAEIDRWLYEIEHGKPKIQIDQRVTGRIVLSPDDLMLVTQGEDSDLPMLEAGYELIEDNPDNPDIAGKDNTDNEPDDCHSNTALPPNDAL